MRAVFMTIVLLLSSLTSFAEGGGNILEDWAPAYNISDSTSIQPYKFNAKQLILPGAFIAVGTFGATNGWMRKGQRWFDKALTATHGSHQFAVDNFLQLIPLGAYIGMGAIGLPARHNIKGRLLAGATATIFALAITEPLKHWVKEERPDGSNRYSFPSGHTAISFMGAELIRLEYNNIGATFGAYSVAIGTGILRLYNRRHWLFDVVTGAGIGIFSARAAYWMLPVYDRLFSTRKNKNAIALVPGYSPEAKGLSLSGAIIF